MRLCEVRRESGKRAEDRIAEDIQHQRRLASPAVSKAAEDERADEPHRERQEQGVGHRGHLDAELLGDVLKQKGQKEEVERVEHPSEKRGEDGHPLLCRKVHRRPPAACALVGVVR